MLTNAKNILFSCANLMCYVFSINAPFYLEHALKDPNWEPVPEKKVEVFVHI